MSIYMNSIDNDYYKKYINNINSIDSKYWGKHAWIFINSIAITYDGKNKDDYIKFFTNLTEILPCNKCREHFKKNLLTLKDSDLVDKYTLLKWLINVRNSIYLEQKRPTVDMEYTVNEIFFNKNRNSYSDILIFVIIVLVIIIFILL